ncbi:MAG: GntR family transcriptional regulator [Treponema sp.]|uniref:GntR family transcriptional regulator n=1 Tax=Treponema sp. TaxID=166 RepID=UPI003FA1FBD2
MKYDNNTPIYVQIIEKIKQDILTGKLTQGEKLPSIQEMAELMEVNQNTMYRAYKECETCGIIETKRGIGSFVITDARVIEQLRAEKIALITRTFIQELRALGFSADDILTTAKKQLGEEHV